METVTIKGGKGLQKYLFEVAQKLGTGGVVRVGFLEGTTYPAEARKALDARDKQGRAIKINPKARAKLVKTIASPLNVATVAFWNNFGTSRVKARPFFSNMIAEKSPAWGRKLGNVAKATGYDTKLTLQRMGEGIQGQLVKYIVDWPADNAERTVELKGFNKGLIDQGIMQRSTGYEVVGV
jgi:hypothetical protein